MDRDAEFLNYIYQNSQMGIDTINQLINVVDDNNFSKELKSQASEYKDINEKACKKLNETGNKEKGLNNLEKISTYMSIGMKTLTDNSPAHISDMMIQGSTMGIIDITKNLNKFSNASEDTKALANKLLKIEQNNIDELKQYLQ